MTVRSIHMTGICGIAMGTLALMLRESGFTVSGSDENMYPPMSDVLADSGITLYEGYSGEHIGKADLVIIGNVISRGNDEAEYVLNTRIPYMSMAQALYNFFLSQKEIIAVSGTHGKTTTASLLAHVLEEAGQSPSYFIGGVSHSGPAYRLGDGRYFIIEGDEYDSAFFEKVPKFMLYRPHHCILTSLEFDHADIYRDLDEIKLWFKRLVNVIPGNGNIVYSAGYKDLEEVVSTARSRVYSYGREGAHFMYRPGDRGDTHMPLEIVHGGESYTAQSSLFGDFNCQNITAASAMAELLGVPTDDIAAAVAAFEGVKRRQEMIYSRDNLVIFEDFAHHPTAVKGFLASLRERYPDHVIWAVYEPRSATSRRNIFQDEMPAGFSVSDRAVIKTPGNMSKIPESERIDVDRLAGALEKLNVDAVVIEDVEDIVEYISGSIDLRQKNCIALMSNGGFGGIYDKLIDRVNGLFSGKV